MRAPTGFHVEWVDGEAVVLDASSRQLHYLNEPAALVYALIQEEGYEAGLARLRGMFGAADGFEDELEQVLSDMVEKGLLVDD